MAVTVLGLPVLLLNQNYEPLNISSVRRALALLYLGKAELLENGRGEVHSLARMFPAPSVIRLVYFIRRPLQHRRLSRREVFIRDRHTCQYCGQPVGDLTLDHVIPRHRGGAHTWENVVTACIHCNHRKAGRTPAEASMYLQREPRSPRPNPYLLFHQHKPLKEWRKFLPWLP